MDDDVALITGASSGIGRATALRAAADGAHVVLAARGAGPLEETAAECRDAGAGSTLVVPTDVRDDSSVRSCVERTLQEHGRIDVVINAAGVVAYGRTEDVPPEIFEGVLRTNLIGSVNVVRHTLPVLRNRGAGTLVLVGSVIGHVAVPTMSPYVLSKWGVRALARQLVVENRDLPQVHIRYIAPGGVDTPIYDQAANYTGRAGRPPPPAASPDHAAAQIMRRLDVGWLPEQLSLVNHGMMAGFQLLPKAYNSLVNVLFPLGATDLTSSAPEGPGNVLDPRPWANRIDGEHGSSLLTVANNVRVRVLGARR